MTIVIVLQVRVLPALAEGNRFNTDGFERVEYIDDALLVGFGVGLDDDEGL